MYALVSLLVIYGGIDSEQGRDFWGGVGVCDTGPSYNPGSYAPCRAEECPTPSKKFLDPYAYDLAWYDKMWQGKFTKHPPPPQQNNGSFALDSE